jgi:hypothetical protein
LVATPRSLPPGRYQATLSSSFAVGIVWNLKCTKTALRAAGIEPGALGLLLGEEVTPVRGDYEE